MIDLKAIGKRIKLYRKKAQQSQSDLAEKLGVSVSYISQIERGIATVSLKRLDEISECIGTSLQSLVSDVNINYRNYLMPEIFEGITSLFPPDKKRLIAMIEAYIKQV